MTNIGWIGLGKPGPPCRAHPDYKDAWKASHDPHQAIFERWAGQAGSSAPATPLLLRRQLAISQG
jgi:hypothetical protein